MKYTIAVIMASYNRANKTLAALHALFSQKGHEKANTFVFLLDDASPDNTAALVKEKYPEVSVFDGTGNLFWNGGMRIAFEKALTQPFDYYLWLNDDTLLYSDALENLLNIAKDNNDEAVVVGATCDPVTKKLTYGGLKRISSWHTIKYKKIKPYNKSEECQTFNGNCVVIPYQIAQAVGNLSDSFSHGLGDLDYGLRVWDKGFKVVVSPKFSGECEHNPIKGSWLDISLPFGERWKKVKSHRGYLPREYAIFARQHAGLFWPILWALPYLRVILTSITARFNFLRRCKVRVEND